MTSYRPPFGRRRGGDTMVVLSRPSPQAFSRSRTADQSGRSMGPFQPMTLTRPVSSLGQSTKKENFEDFVARMMKTDEFGPGLKVHSAQTTLANGVDPLQSEERKKQLQFRLQQRLNKQSESLDARQSQDQRQNDGENNVRQKNDAGADGIKSRFGAGWDDMRSFQNRKRIWKSSLKSTLKFLQGSNYNQRPNPSELDVDSSTLEILAKRPAESDTKSNLTDDLNKILQRGSALLLASSALKPRSKVKKEPLKKPIPHSPPSTSVVSKPKTKSGPQAHPMFERNTTWKDWLQGSGFPFDEFENEISGAIKTAAREMKRSIGGEIPENSASARKKPFDGIKISSLVGTNAGKVQGFRQSRVLGEQDNMNPLQLKMVQGLQDAELSSFLENHGRRNPDFGMQIIPGRALDPGSEFSTAPRGMSKVKGQHISRDHTSTLEPKFRALPRSVKSRFGEDFGVVRKDESDNKDLSEYGSNRSPRFRNKSPDVPKIDRLKKLSFMDVTKSQFIREMRQHQSQFQQMKSKDEMRKSFPKTYIFPHHIRRKK